MRYALVMEMSLDQLGLALAAAAAGGVIQGSIGFGLSLVLVPVLTLIAPGALPASILLLAIPMTIWMAVREGESIDVRGFVEITLGRLPGTAAAVWVLTILSAGDVAVFVGSVVIVAVVLSVIAPEFELRTRWRLLAGALSGFMGTAAAVGGPPLAIAYQRRPGPQLRSTLALSFAVGATVSLIALAVAGEVTSSDVWLALRLLPGLALGLFLATRLQAVLDRDWLRPLVLGLAAIGGVAAVVKGIV